MLAGPAGHLSPELRWYTVRDVRSNDSFSNGSERRAYLRMQDAKSGQWSPGRDGRHLREHQGTESGSAWHYQGLARTQRKAGCRALRKEQGALAHAASGVIVTG